MRTIDFMFKGDNFKLYLHLNMAEVTFSSFIPHFLLFYRPKENSDYNAHLRIMRIFCIIIL